MRKELGGKNKDALYGPIRPHVVCENDVVEDESGRAWLAPVARVDNDFGYSAGYVSFSLAAHAKGEKGALHGTPPNGWRMSRRAKTETEREEEEVESLVFTLEDREAATEPYDVWWKRYPRAFQNTQTEATTQGGSEEGPVRVVCEKGWRGMLMCGASAPADGMQCTGVCSPVPHRPEKVMFVRTNGVYEEIVVADISPYRLNDVVVFRAPAGAHIMTLHPRSETTILFWCATQAGRFVQDGNQPAARAVLVHNGSARDVCTPLVLEGMPNERCRDRTFSASFLGADHVLLRRENGSVLFVNVRDKVLYDDSEWLTHLASAPLSLSAALPVPVVAIPDTNHVALVVSGGVVLCSSTGECVGYVESDTLGAARHATYDRRLSRLYVLCDGNEIVMVSISTAGAPEILGAPVCISPSSSSDIASLACAGDGTMLCTLSDGTLCHVDLCRGTMQEVQHWYGMYDQENTHLASGALVSTHGSVALCTTEEAMCGVYGGVAQSEAHVLRVRGSGPSTRDDKQPPPRRIVRPSNIVLRDNQKRKKEGDAIVDRVSIACFTAAACGLLVSVTIVLVYFLVLRRQGL